MAAVSDLAIHPIELVWDPDAVQSACLLTLHDCPQPSATAPLTWSQRHASNGRGAKVPVVTPPDEANAQRRWEGEPNFCRGNDFVMVPLNDPRRPYCWAVGPLRRTYAMRSVRTAPISTGPDTAPGNIDPLSDDEGAAPLPITGRPSWLDEADVVVNKPQPAWLQGRANVSAPKTKATDDSPDSDTEWALDVDKPAPDDDDDNGDGHYGASFDADASDADDNGDGKPKPKRPRHSRLRSLLGL